MVISKTLKYLKIKTATHHHTHGMVLFQLALIALNSLICIERCILWKVSHANL